MQSVDTVEAEEAGKVSKVYGKGYKLRDRLIRPAMVQVTVKKKEESQNEESVETDA